ncbi:hypothetical protein J437_LFUL009873 [Ladona fulva]|uniref:CBF1-interacting co-repressor CIR N-terminal domain-containing protein n=1 Tax=Ladona fulva TaxID=123851 RepID=A0A8K0P2M4_LADFU|nr:hypothetical protein J437_LFUL009873 [Ladona fulva]
MNILPKKRWHVRTKENIARVRRDEAQAAEEEKEKIRRIQLAEREHRTALLREKAKERCGEAKKEPETPPPQSEGHVNFFEDIEKGIRDYGVNLEHEKEKKEEKEKYEKSIGLLTYLGQDTNEATGQVSWYNKVPDRLSKSSPEESEKVKMKKNLADPLVEMQKFLHMKDGGKGGVKSFERPSVSSVKRKREEETSYYHQSSKRSKKEKKSKKERRKHKKKRSNRKPRSSSDESDKESSNGSEEERKKANIERLRQERIKREAKEAEKARILIAKAKGEPIESEEDKSQNNALFPIQKYNSQFNPHLARQNFNKVDPLAPFGT